jgi:L-lactate dehydrogenase complex protein LldF
LNACPVYKNIGGHSYGTTYSGPIGSVITPHLQGMQDFKHLSFASSLCGNCTAVCPVKIDLHKLLLVNRRQSVTQELTTKNEDRTWYFWRRAMMNRKLMNLANSKLKNMAMRLFVKSSWGNRRELPVIAPKSFNERWRESHKK